MELAIGFLLFKLCSNQYFYFLPKEIIMLSEYEELGFLKNIILLTEIDLIVYCPNTCEYTF